METIAVVVSSVGNVLQILRRFQCRAPEIGLLLGNRRFREVSEDFLETHGGFKWRDVCQKTE